MGVVCLTIAMAELYSKQRLDPIIDGCAPARAKIPPNRGKNSGNTLRLKTFPGGMVRLTGANSANALKSMPAKNALYEEPDEFVADLQGQGNAVEMTRRRLTTYGRRAKEFANCTPTLSSKTIIEPLFKAGDQRLYRMPCPHGCGHKTVFTKELFRFEKGRHEGAHFVCENPECGKPILEARHKTAMMAAGVWVPQVENAPPDTPRSYYPPAFYSPVGWESWAAIAKKVEQAEGNYELSKSVWNQIYGLPWSDVTETPNAETIWARRSGYVSRQVPAEVYFLTAGIDHIEIGVSGFGKKGRRWLIEHVRLRGRYTDPELWARAKAFLYRRYLHPSGAVLPIRKAGVDCGKWPDVVMPWVMRQDPDWIVATRGSEKIDAPVLKESKWRLQSADGTWSSEEGVKYWTLGVGHLKLELMRQLNLPRPAPGDETPPGTVELPQDIDLGFVEQLVSEEYVEIKSKAQGRPKMAWRPIGGVRHEALDTANIARAMVQGDNAPPRQRTYVDRTARGPAQRGCPNDFAFRLQDRVEIRAYRESMVFLDVDAGATQKIDPNLATCWRLQANGPLTLAFEDPTPVPGLDAYAETPLYVTSVVLRISRPAGATITWPAGTLFQKPLRDLSSTESPLGPASEASLDEFVLEYWPGDGWSVNASAWRLG